MEVDEAASRDATEKPAQLYIARRISLDADRSVTIEGLRKNSDEPENGIWEAGTRQDALQRLTVHRMKLSVLRPHSQLTRDNSKPGFAIWTRVLAPRVAERTT